MGRDVDVRWERHLVRSRFGIGVEDEGKVYVKGGVFLYLRLTSSCTAYRLPQS